MIILFVFPFYEKPQELSNKVNALVLHAPNIKFRKCTTVQQLENSLPYRKPHNLFLYIFS